MVEIDKLLRRTINDIDNTVIVNWNSRTANVLKKIYNDYYIDRSKNYMICPFCNKKTYLTFNSKSDLKVFKYYCDNCVILLNKND